MWQHCSFCNGVGRVACGPGTVCFLESAVGFPVLFSPHTVSVPALVGGLFSISLGISTFASLGMNSSCDCQMCLQSLLFFFGTTCHLLVQQHGIYLFFNLCLGQFLLSIRGLRFHAFWRFDCYVCEVVLPYFLVTRQSWLFLRNLSDESIVCTRFASSQLGNAINCQVWLSDACLHIGSKQ